MGGIGPVIDPEKVIVAVTGIADWRPLFVQGLVAAFLFAFMAGIVIALLLWGTRR